MWAVVVPTIRPEKFAAFTDAWTPLFEKHDVRLYPVWDMERKPAGALGTDWRSIPDFIPRKTDMIRSWGFYQAWEGGAQYTLSLDDDVSPAGKDPFAEYEEEFARTRPCSPYFDVGAFSMGSPMRGFPYADRHAQTVVQYGGWKGVPDLDAVTQIGLPAQNAPFRDVNIAVPRGVPMTTCAMNFAFRTHYTQMMWQLPLLEGRYNRFGDIWSGLLQKRVLDACGMNMVLNGKATVIHDRASDPYNNLCKEAVGLELNEKVWELSDFPGEYEPDEWLVVYERFLRYFASAVWVHDEEYGNHFCECKDKWLSLFS